MSDLYQFHPQLVVRAPARPLALPLTEVELAASPHDAAFMEALYLASPVLHEECRKWGQGAAVAPRRLARLQSAIARYHARMRRRCTPFGLFAGCAVVQWGTESSIELNPARHTRHTRLDMHYLCALAQHLATHPDIRPLLHYRPNSSWYRLGDEIRYIEQHYLASEPRHQISSLAVSEALEQLLAVGTAGLSYAALLTLLDPDGASQAEVAGFLDALIEAQVLVSELEAPVTGVEFLPHIRTVLLGLPAEPLVRQVLTTLDEVAALLLALDAATSNTEVHYQRIVAALEPLGVPMVAGKLFQTDTVWGVAPEATLDQAVQADLLVALDALAHLASPVTNSRLTKFCRQFEARYETREVPLLDVLDPESGLLYSAYGKSSYSPLLDDLALPLTSSPDEPAALSEAQQFLREQLREAERCGHYSLDLSLATLKRFGQPADVLPPSLGILFRLATNGSILLDRAGGSSAVNLLGRFAHADPQLEQVVRSITAAEQQHNPTVAFAELCHLPASRIGNILLRPAFRDLEIPYLAQSGQPAAKQVLVQDLTLRLRRGQLELHSRRTGQRIVPRLSTAHNFTGPSLPVYQLLCDLQTQGLQAQLGFTWDIIARDLPFSPRLTCGRVVLSPATWRLSEADLQPLLTAPSGTERGRLHELQHRWQLPRCFTLVDGDNELLVDADNPLLVRAWLDTVRGRPTIELKECLLDAAASPVRDSTGQAYAAQFVALLIRQTPCYSAVPSAIPTSANVTRCFALGSEWLYYKFYCGPAMANRLLREAIGPLVTLLAAAELVDKWFFVRYADPEPHLRLRLHLPQMSQLGEVLRIVGERLSPWLESGTIWKTQTDTYQRELERYGPYTIELTEELFCWQSSALLAYLDSPAQPEPGDDDYWLWGLRACDELLRAFDCTLTQRLALATDLHERFTREFKPDKAMQLQLDRKYRHFRPAIEQTLAGASLPPGPLRTLAAQIRQRMADYPTEVSFEALMSSYLHMLLNRLFPGEARLHELVLYGFLTRYYKSAYSRSAVASA